jgi:hypothetical protein
MGPRQGRPSELVFLLREKSLKFVVSRTIKPKKFTFTWKLPVIVQNRL